MCENLGMEHQSDLSFTESDINVTRYDFFFTQLIQLTEQPINTREVGQQEEYSYFLLYLKVERSFKVTGGESGVERWLSRWKCMSLLQRIWWVPNTHTGWLATCNPKGSDTSIWPPRACVCTCTCAHTHTHTHSFKSWVFKRSFQNWIDGTESLMSRHVAYT